MITFFRPHRGLLVDSMAECVEVRSVAEIMGRLPYLRRIVSVDLYHDQPDTRIGWDKTYIVMAEYADGTVAPCGFTNAPLPE